MGTSFGRLLIIMGLVLIALGLLFTIGGRFTGIGRLPGDILIRRGPVTFYFPLATSILLSVLLTVLLSILFRR